MKRIFFLLAMTAATAVQAQLKVNGTLTGAEGRKLYFLSEDGKYTDSTVLAAGGKFAFAPPGKPAPEAMYALFLEGVGLPSLMVSDQPEVTIDLEAKDFPVAKSLKSGQQTRWMQDYHKVMRPLQQEVQALNAEAQQIGQEETAKQEAFRQKAAAFDAKLQSEGKNFIKAHPKAMASLFLLFGDMQKRLSKHEFANLFNGLDQSVRSTPFGKSVAMTIAQETTGNSKPVAAPDFSQADPQGKMISLSSFRGKYVLIDFWASWCGPCRMENPNVVAAYNRFKDKNFTIFGVSLDEDKSRWLQAIKQDKLTWPQVSDLKGWGNEAAAMYGVRGIPQNFLLDPEGNIIAANLRGEALERKLEEILK
ncbi:TlpA disulfide reductase family protein [Chitinophaga pollutisoli]|uniref:TlpA disulfide reductase family protein n=1 Tax=Chitinophaga pollutisoli TaxID=3133966 RepID=A0ABZ2YLW8_9BACT